MKLVLVTNLTHTDAGRFVTAFERYEYELAGYLRMYTTLEIILVSQRLESSRVSTDECELRGIRSRRKIFGRYTDVFRSIGVERGDVVVFWGSGLRLISYLLRCRRRHKFSLIQFVYDYNFPGIEGSSGVRRLVRRIRSRVSDYMVSTMDGFILFNERAWQHIRSSKPYVVVWPGLTVDNSEIDPPANGPNGEFTILYSGTLSEYNSVAEILEAFHSIEEARLRLRVFGTGDLADLVERYSKMDPRIFYGGLVTAEQVSRELLQANLLLNIRITEHIVNDFAFPSKLMQYLGSNRLVLSTDFSPEIEHMRSSIYVIPDNSVESIRMGLLAAYHATPAETAEKLSNMRHSVLSERYSWEASCILIEGFLTSILTQQCEPA